MKKLLIIVSILTSLGGLAQEPQSTFVEVTGTGVVTVAPDQVVIQSRIEHIGASASKVKSQNDDVVEKVIDYLKSMGIPSSHIKTEYIRLNKDYNHNTKETSFSANQAISIRLNDLEEYERIMSGLLESGLNRIDGVLFQSSKKEELESSARRKAVLNAKQKAEELANSLDQEIGKALYINEVESGNFQPVFRAMEMQEDMGSRETIAPGEMEISIKVNVKFVLK